MLHLTNGDAAAERLRQAGLPGAVIVWADVLHEGPVPDGNDARHFREVRARYLAERRYGNHAEVLAGYENWDAALARFREHDELVLWFEHDLFDQLLIARHLHWLAHHAPFDTAISIICIDRFPGIARFHGLGQLSPAELAGLMPSRRGVSPEQIEAGARVWRAFTAPDPRALSSLARAQMPALPFMPGALVRLLEELPWTTDGLSRIERGVLAQVGAGPRSTREIFRALQDQEERVFLGDISFRSVLRAMAGGDSPLVRIHDQAPVTAGLSEEPVELASAGVRVLDGREDAVGLRGIDRWIGGVHLRGHGPVWRWDPDARQVRLV
jgi:hypothetical protein